mgnify:CR=1 FL=1
MTASRNFRILVAACLLVLAAVASFIFWTAPVRDGAISWTAPMIARGWMAWTLATAVFFWLIAALLVAFTLIGIGCPEVPRTGILRIETTRGDRLFISLLGAGFINLIWLGLVGSHQPWALIVCLLYALAVFRWV